MKFQHKFLDEIPGELENGILYISISYKVTLHLCACGCKNKVVARLSPKDWKLIFDGEGASLFPSIGNWNFNCKSHYWIRNGSVINIPNGPLKKKKRKKYFFFF
ncbi:MAG: hypothetical protein DI529_01170 [Chryseobacterium sp.]|nr:MAG: hypothetical protein DI529_01170 [Chryseobacterium sp.]